MSDLPAALQALQADLPPIKRTGRGQVGTRGYRYPEYPKILAVVRPILHKHGFVWHTEPTMAPMGGDNLWRFVLRYELRYLPTNESIQGNYPLAEGAAQAQGGQISYAKRYCLVAVLDLEVEGEDTDAMDTPTRRPVRGAKVTGPDHERLREGLHTATPEDRPADRGPLPDDENPWQAPEGSPETDPGTIDPRDRSAIMAACKGMTRDARLSRVSVLAGRTVESVNDLSFVEGQMVRARLKEQA